MAVVLLLLSGVVLVESGGMAPLLNRVCRHSVRDFTVSPQMNAEVDRADLFTLAPEPAAESEAGAKPVHISSRTAATIVSVKASPSKAR